MSSPGDVSAPYTTILAPVHDRIGFGGFAAEIIPRLVPFVQGNLDWYGRRVLDLGCGTGAAARWLAQHTMNVTAIDQSSDMLQQARASIDASGLGLEWVQGDIRSLTGQHAFDIAFALDVVNELGGLRDLEAMLTSVHAALNAGKLLVFDLHTVAGLAEDTGIEIIINEDDAFVSVERSFDHERQMQTNRFHAFVRLNGAWQRRDAVRVLRAYPVQAVAALLTRTGYQLMALLTPRFAPVEIGAITVDRVLFAARTVVTK